MLAVAVARHLDELEVVTFDESGIAGNTFVGSMPSSPDEAIAISPAGGNPTNSHDGYDEPIIQVRCRAAASDPRPAYRQARLIYEALVGLHAVWLDEDGDDAAYVIRTTAVQSDPFPLGVDDNGRPEYVQNFAFRVRALTAHRV